MPNAAINTLMKHATHSPESSPSTPYPWQAWAEDDDISPAMRQFCALKAAHAEVLLFYRMGDFYELFFDDALVAAQVLDIALTKRNQIKSMDVPMCGVPYHAAEQYLHKLIAAGHKVAICEQMETPEEAKKRGYKAVVQREVVRIVTPGTITEEGLLNPQEAHYLVALTMQAQPEKQAKQTEKQKEQVQWAMAVAELSTGHFSVSALSATQLGVELARLSPREILVSASLLEDASLREVVHLCSVLADSCFSAKAAQRRLQEYFGLHTLEALGCWSDLEYAACGALLDYVHITQKDTTPRLDVPKQHTPRAYLHIDPATRRSLEITHTQHGTRKGSVLHAIDRTKSAGGARVLAGWLNSPLLDVASIEARQRVVRFFVEQPAERTYMREVAAALPDMERALGRVLMERGGPRDLQALLRALIGAEGVRTRWYKHESLPYPPLLLQWREQLGQHNELAHVLASALEEDVPHLARSGGFIRGGYHPVLDEWRVLKNESGRMIAALRQRYSEQTGISSLKIQHNNVLGYFVEITPLHESKVLDCFIHRQSMKNALRYTTTELAELEQKISEAAGKALKLELELYEALVARVREHQESLVLCARALAMLDAASALAELAVVEHYTCPELCENPVLDIHEGRHVLVEQYAKRTRSGGGFVGNDCTLHPQNRLWLLTGPNMAGKSTFLRQNALIVLLAQMGSYVPATSARIGVVDMLFSRVGAADDLARGQSTFMVEMVETASILHQATDRSFVILDEIGRGTATYDGVSIAWAVAEYLYHNTRCRGLFATHYHELTRLDELLPALHCYTMHVKEWRGELSFLHKVIPGVADKSYGVHVARLAGMPKPVLERAGALLQLLEASATRPLDGLRADVLPLFAAVDDAPAPASVQAPAPMPDFSHPISQYLESLDLDTISPREALEVLYQLKSMG